MYICTLMKTFIGTQRSATLLQSVTGLHIIAYAMPQSDNSLAITAQTLTES